MLIGRDRRGGVELKIALVSSHANSFAGAPKYVTSLARALAVDHEVTIFSATLEGLEGTSVRHRRVRVPVSDGNVFELAFSLVSAAMLWRSHLKGEFDIVHSHRYGSPFFSDVFTSHYCEQEGIDQVRREADGALRCSYPQRLRSLAMARIEKRLFGRAVGIPLIVVSERMKRDFVRHYRMPAERIFVVYSGADCERYTPANVPLYRDEVRRRHSLAPDELVVLFVGGDWERKGVAQAIEALSLLGSCAPRLLVVGPGRIGAYRKIASDRGVAERVMFTGGRKEAWEYYAAGDVFLLPTRYEAFGLSILEAMASGLPVLVSRSAGAAELITDGADGLLLEDPMDPVEIARKLEALLRDEGLRRRLGRRARLTALQYSWDEVGHRTVEVYERVLSRRNLGTGLNIRIQRMGKGAD